MKRCLSSTNHKNPDIDVYDKNKLVGFVNFIGVNCKRSAYTDHLNWPCEVRSIRRKRIHKFNKALLTQDRRKKETCRDMNFFKFRCRLPVSVKENWNKKCGIRRINFTQENILYTVKWFRANALCVGIRMEFGRNRKKKYKTEYSRYISISTSWHRYYINLINFAKSHLIKSHIEFSKDKFILSSGFFDKFEDVCTYDFILII